MTRFRNLESVKNKNKREETVFNKFVTGSHDIRDSISSPSLYDNVDFIGFDRYYGDVFKAWNNDSDDFTIYFGEKGDEFDD